MKFIYYTFVFATLACALIAIASVGGWLFGLVPGDKAPLGTVLGVVGAIGSAVVAEASAHSAKKIEAAGRREEK